MKAIIYTPEEMEAIKEIRRTARNRYLRERRKRIKANLTDRWYVNDPRTECLKC